MLTVQIMDGGNQIPLRLWDFRTFASIAPSNGAVAKRVPLYLKKAYKAVTSYFLIDFAVFGAKNMLFSQTPQAGGFCLKAVILVSLRLIQVFGLVFFLFVCFV